MDSFSRAMNVIFHPEACLVLFCVFNRSSLFYQSYTLSGEYGLQIISVLGLELRGKQLRHQLWVSGVSFPEVGRKVLKLINF